MSWSDTVCDFPANLIYVCVHMNSITYVYAKHVCVGDGVNCFFFFFFLFTPPSQLRLPVCVDVWGVLWLFWVGNRKLVLPECLQLRPAIGQSAVDAVPLLLLELAAEQDKAWDANDEGDGPQSQRQAQVGYPERGQVGEDKQMADGATGSLNLWPVGLRVWFRALPVGGGVVDSTGSDAAAPLLTPFQACGVDDCSKVDGRRDPRCESDSTDRQKDIINATGLSEWKQKLNTNPSQFIIFFNMRLCFWEVTGRM